MRTYSHRLSYALLFQSLLLLGCQKDIKESSINGEVQGNASVQHKNGGLVLIAATSEFGDETFEYNEDGMLSNWFVGQLNTNYVHEYESGRLATSRLYSGGLLQITVKFFYNKKGQRDHEIWYQGNTDEVWDEVFYTFNAKGEGLKMESFVQNYYVLNEYTNDGNIKSWAFYFNNIIAAGSVYTYGHQLKNPFSATPGLVYAYPFANGFFYSNKTYSTSESFTSYDENGDVLEEFPQDPSKTVATAGPQNFVATSDFWDDASSDYIHFVFTYEKSKKDISNITAPKNTKRAAILKLILRDSKKTMKEKVQEFRRDSRN